ncbi:soluble scavenger receptor cysteine-rich domain-containing protein SSC5D-like [Pecten maximus]|uniref:soluble scavenger receptor cysteine-rich domain-containing protein SSC5D-like n=1 Tax=Pecten maximus TaxID=6579 RepID=UPI001458C89A|nr:soluble scavenger receptor cysteine-rich domain-containing protein SSC5D-like [Pecten maximus]
MDRHRLVLSICVYLGVVVSANNSLFRYTPTNPTAPLTAEGQISTSRGVQPNDITDTRNRGKLVIVDTNSTTPQDITAVKAGGDNIVVTVETGPNATPSPPAQTRTTDWNWIVTPAPKATPSPPPPQTGTTDWNWIVTPTPKTTPSPAAQTRPTDWNWIVTPTPKTTPSPAAQTGPTDWNLIVNPTPKTTPSPPTQTRSSDWNWIVTPTPRAPVHYTPAPYVQYAATTAPNPFLYGYTNTMGYFGNTPGYFGTPSYWEIAYQQPQQTTADPGIKYGQCPAPNVVGAKCGHRCYRDTECPQDWKCCNDGSGRQDGCCHARRPTEVESFMTSLWDMPPSQEIQNEMP